MSETVLLMIREIIEVCLIPLLGVLVTYLVKYINTKSKELEANTDNELAKKYISLLSTTITNCVIATNQTYVETLKKQGKCWYLVFPFEDKVEFQKVDIQYQLIFAVDLGINNNATCSIMQSDGTVVGRKFVNLATEKDHLYKALNRVKKAQQNGARKCPTLWKHVNDLNTDISRKTAKEIIDFAVLYNADVIVFEHLDTQGKKKGRGKQKLALWRKQEIQKLVEHKAHILGIRISHICAWNTSKLAFDGSGKVERGTYVQNGVEKYNYSICTFPNGKQYHCDLNASYNIGARYFIRELLKSDSVMRRLPSQTKDSDYGTGTTRTLSTLIRLNADLYGNAI